MPDDVGVTDAVEAVARALWRHDRVTRDLGHATWPDDLSDDGQRYYRDRARAAIATMQPALDVAREAGRREGLEQAAIEIARLKGGLASVAELLGSDLGHFRRAEGVEAFLRGERVDWMDAADAR